MMKEQDRIQFEEYAKIFLTNYLRQDSTDFNICDFIRKATLNYPNDPSVKSFYKKLASIWEKLLDNKEFKLLFSLTDHHKNYKDQKIAKYYRESIFPYEFMLYALITNSNSGRACYLRSLIDTFKKTGVEFDSTFLTKFADYYDSLPVQFSKCFYNDPNEFLPIELERREYILSTLKQNQSRRSIKFKIDLRNRLVDEEKRNGNQNAFFDIDYDEIDEAYKNYVIGNIGELLFVEQMYKSQYFIHSSKEISNHTGYDVYDYGDREYLYEVKTTIRHKKQDEKDSFKISPYEYERMVQSFNQRKYGAEEYIVARVFLTPDLDIDEILYLRLKDINTLEDNFGNTYTSDKKDAKGSLIFERNGFIRKMQTSDKN